MKTRESWIKPLIWILDVLIRSCFCLAMENSSAHASAQTNENPLPRLHLSSRAATSSGISSGAFMSIQLQVAFSNLFHGAGSFAGGIYACAESDVTQAQNLCMENPQKLDAQKYIELAQKLESQSLIDPLSNLKSIPIYLFAGTKDSTVRMEASVRSKEFFQAFGANIQENFSLASEHGLPTINFGNECDHKSAPWLQKCQVDGAGLMLSFLYSDLQTPTEDAVESNLQSFDQTPFIASGDGLEKIGFIYIPTECRHNTNPDCRLHVALHGCSMSPNYINDAFIRHGGYNRWAEKNHLVILYPSVGASELNPRGCWDWFGYTGPDYFNKKSRQMNSIVKMLKFLNLGP